MDIECTVRSLIKKYKTNDPFELAGYLNIKVNFRPLGGINGFYSKVNGHKFIYINSNIDEESQRISGAHELGHAIRHPDDNSEFIKYHTFFSKNKYEIEANTFASFLLISDGDLIEMKLYGYTIEQMSRCLHIPPELIELRMQDLR